MTDEERKKKKKKEQSILEKELYAMLRALAAQAVNDALDDLLKGFK